MRPTESGAVARALEIDDVNADIPEESGSGGGAGFAGSRAVGETNMSVVTLSCTEAEELRALSKAEIDRRLRWIGNVVTRTDGLKPIGADALQPRWITAAELVRRVRPFLSCN